MVTPAELVDGGGRGGSRPHRGDRPRHDGLGQGGAGARGRPRGCTVVAGQEITTSWPAQTHVLGWFLEKPVQARACRSRTRSMRSTTRAALAIVPHPFMPVYFGSIQPGMLRRLLEKHPVDGIEMMFTVPIGARRRRLLDAFSGRQSRAAWCLRSGAATATSARHDIASACSPRTRATFRAAIVERRTTPAAGHPARRCPPASRCASSGARWWQLPLAPRGQL